MTTEIKTALTGAVHDAGLEDFGFHDLRHSLSRVAKANGPFVTGEDNE